MYVKGLWRYTVKTLAGVPLELAELTPTGIPGDRIVHVRGPEGVRTSRRHHLLLGLKGTLGPDGFHVNPDGVIAKCPSKYEEKSPAGAAKGT